MIAPGWGAAIREAEKVTAAHAVPAAGTTAGHGGWRCMFCGLATEQESKPAKGPCSEREPVATGHAWVREVTVEADEDVRASLLAAAERRATRLRGVVLGALSVAPDAAELDKAVRAAELAMVGGEGEAEAIEGEIVRLSAPPIVEPEPTPVVQEPAASTSREVNEPDESSSIAQPVDDASSTPAAAETPAKRGRGRPRKDGTTATVPAAPRPAPSPAPSGEAASGDDGHPWWCGRSVDGQPVRLCESCMPKANVSRRSATLAYDPHAALAAQTIEDTKIPIGAHESGEQWEARRNIERIERALFAIEVVGGLHFVSGGLADAIEVARHELFAALGQVSRDERALAREAERREAYRKAAAE